MTHFYVYCSAATSSVRGNYDESKGGSRVTQCKELFESQFSDFSLVVILLLAALICSDKRVAVALR